MNKPIITEDQIKKYAKNKCIKKIAIMKYPIISESMEYKKNCGYFYEENRNDNFAKWRKRNITNQMFNQDVIGNDVFDW